ncbi:MAG: hypothetical protein B7Z42_10410, partial [Brevundimonas sp. 12-68-7]
EIALRGHGSDVARRTEQIIKQLDLGISEVTVRTLISEVGLTARCGVYSIPFDGREIGGKQLKRIEDAYAPPMISRVEKKPLDLTKAGNTRYDAFKKYMQEPF